ncbi:SNF2 family N-terminal domain-containing protein [Colletotrichum cereale]|nr:SNF2 family N-terminal domain-containing protein [Colletotrichum cereale]
MEAHCNIRDEYSVNPKKRKHGQEQLYHCTLSIIIYGPLTMFNEVGNFFEKHQKQALSFMTRRETARFPSTDKNGLWEARRNGGENLFINKVSGAINKKEPPVFRGGVLADPMSLGKTLTMISLILSALERKVVRPSNISSQRTLVVVPLSHGKQCLKTLSIWCAYLAISHVRRGAISWYRHHDKLCATSISTLETYDVVLTTYDTVMREWKRCFSSGFQRPVLFSTTWDRLILDEAHLIRNPKSQRTKAACALDADPRWAVTGTPIQNNLQDLARILAFLRVYPYSDPRTFKSDITSLWKSGDGDEALRRLKLVIRCLFLRRPKTAIHLPTRRDLQYPLEFRPEERSFYQEFKAKAMEEIENALMEESTSTATASVLKYIDALRTICNLGTKYRETSKARRNDWGEIAQNTFDVQRELGLLYCSACDTRLLETEDAVEETNFPQYFFRCLCFICSECSERQIAQGENLACNCNLPVPCQVASVHMGSKSKSLLCTVWPVQSHERLPTKIEAIVSDIKGLNPDVKCVVFSMWRSTLDLVQTGLERCGISSLRYDGSLNIHERHQVVQRFQEDPSLRVLVLTLSCGAVGLTLTAARRAYLMEPHWNPTQEDQALARIHRIGQAHEVTTVRYFIKDSYEESVIKLQKSKKLLADILLSKDGGSHSQGSLNGLQVNIHRYLKTCKEDSCFKN